MSPAIWLLMGWIVIAPTRTDVVSVNGKGLNLYQHDTRAECFERPSVLEDLATMDDPIRDLVNENLVRHTYPPLNKKKVDELVEAHLKGLVSPALPPVHVSDLRGGLLFNEDAQYRAMCVKFDLDNYRDA